MNSVRLQTRESLLALLTCIKWPEYMKYGIDINQKNSDSVEFIVYRNSKILNPDDEMLIESIIKKEMPDLKASDGRNIIYLFLMRLSSNDVLINHLKEEYGIYFYSDSYEVHLTITKDRLSKL